MTDEQHRNLRRLNQCTFLPGSYTKRFVRDMASRPKEYELTEKQAAYLDKLVHQYRKQLAGIP